MVPAAHMIAALSGFVLWSLLCCQFGHAEIQADTDPAVRLELTLSKEHAYPGERVLAIATLRSRAGTLGNIKYPRLLDRKVEFFPDSQAEEPDTAESAVYRFTGGFSVAAPGAVRIGPAQLECEVMERVEGGAAFFGAAEPRKVVLTSHAAVLTVDPLPAGAPPSFSGTIGAFSMKVVAKPERAVVGEPLTVVSTIAGTGNPETAMCPTLQANGLKSYPPREIRSGGTLTCEQVIVPLEEEPLPAVEWSYFDPSVKKYRTERAFLPRPVRSPSSRQSAAILTVAEPAARAVHSPYRIIALSTTLVLLLSVLLFLRTKQRSGIKKVPSTLPLLETPIPLTELRQAFSDGDSEKFYAEMFKVLQHAVGTSNGEKPSSVASAAVNNDWEGSEGLKELFESCIRIRYGGTVPEKETMEGHLRQLDQILK